MYAPDPQSEAEYLKIGDWRFYVASHELIRNGESIRLEPRVAGLLLYLASHPGEPISREALLNALWPGVVVSDEALTNAINKLRRAFKDDRSRPQVIETIPKAGYRLIAPVLPHRAATAAAMPDTRTLCSQLRPRWIIPITLLTAGSLIVGIVTKLNLSGLGSGVSVPAQQTTGSRHEIRGQRPALAVLPFDNLDARPEEAYFADGVTDDVITRLAKHPGLMVIARDSTFYYKGKPLDLRAIAVTLNVDYVLRGSLRRESGVLKLNVWLVDVRSGDHIWAEHYERKAGQIFEVQNEISRGVEKALSVAAGELPEPHTETDNPRAYDNLLLGRQHFYRFESSAENLKARTYFKEAIRLDPGFATAHAMLAWTYAFEAMNGWAVNRLDSLQRAERIATRAIAIQPALSLAYFVRGLAYREQREYVMALVEAEKAIEYAPNSANGHVLLATLLYYAGRPEEGLARIQEAMRINPHHPYNYHFHLGQAYFVLHRYREAIDAFKRGLSSNPASERMRVWLAAALAQSGDIEAAKWEAEQVMAADADFSSQRLMQAFPFKDPSDIDDFLTGVRLAGLK